MCPQASAHKKRVRRNAPQPQQRNNLALLKTLFTK
jgi:hypothetical protein